MNTLSALIRSSLASALIGTAAAACGSDDMTSPTPTSTLIVTPDRLVLGAGMTRQLSASVVDQSGAPASGAAISFASTDPSRASVTPEGLVSYTGPGPAEIRASSEGAVAVVPYTGLQSGHPLGTVTSSARLPGDQRGDRPFGVAVDAEGRILISQSGSGLVAFGIYPDTGFATGILGGTPTSIALLGAGTALVTPSGPDADDASVIELSSGRVLAQVPLDVPAFSAVTAPDSQTAYLGTTDGRVLVFDRASSTVTGSIDLEVEKSRANHLAVNAAGTLLYASSFTTGTISEIDLIARSVARLFIVGGEPQGVAVSLDGTELYVGVINTDEAGLIQVVDPAARRIERTIESCGRVPRRIAFGFSGGLAVIVDETGCATFVE